MLCMGGDLFFFQLYRQDWSLRGGGGNVGLCLLHVNLRFLKVGVFLQRCRRGFW